jgi:hypothetical protein
MINTVVNNGFFGIDKISFRRSLLSFAELATGLRVGQVYTYIAPCKRYRSGDHRIRVVI